MPRQDQTGPLGYGPATGWGRGPCGRGLKRGRGFGQGLRRFWSPQNEKQALEQEENFLQKELEAIRQEIANLKRSKK